MGRDARRSLDYGPKRASARDDHARPGKGLVAACWNGVFGGFAMIESPHKPGNAIVGIPLRRRAGYGPEPADAPPAA